MAENNINKKEISSFQIPIKIKEDHKENEIGAQKISFIDEENVINFGRNLMENGEAAMSIVIDENGEYYLKVNNKFSALDGLKEYADNADENYTFYKIEKVQCYANEDITFKLTNENAQALGTLTIRANEIVHEKNKQKTTLFTSKNEKEFVNIDFPKNFFELIDEKNNDNPIHLKGSKNSPCSLPAQMFDCLKNIEGVKTKEWTNVGRSGQTLRIAIINGTTFVVDGPELKEVRNGFQVINSTDNSKDLVIRFNNTNASIGKAKDARFLGNVPSNLCVAPTIPMFDVDALFKTEGVSIIYVTNDGTSKGKFVGVITK